MRKTVLFRFPLQAVGVLLSVVLLWTAATTSPGAIAAPVASTTLTAIADARVSEGAPADNYGIDPQLLMGHASKAGLTLSLVRFNLTSLPVNSMITSATLRVYVQDVSGGGPVSISARRVNAPWGESTVNWSNRPGVNPLPVVSAPIGGAGWATWDLTPLVQAWHGGLEPAHGVELGGPGTTDYTIYASSREGTQPPELLVLYELGATATSTQTIRPTLTPTGTPRPSLTPTPTGSATPRPSFTPTHTATSRPSSTPTANPTATPTQTATAVPRPDLVVADIWQQGAALCLQIRNIGQAPAPAGHLLALWIDGLSVRQQAVPIGLAPGERFKACFQDPPACTPPEDLVRACADVSGTVVEADEANNCREETWVCDAAPPVILSGPTVSEITMDSAVVSWTTDEASSSVARYGRLAGFYAQGATTPPWTLAHRVVLTGLAPSALYRVEVQSADPAGNSTTSPSIVFRTLAASDDRNPTVAIPAGGPLAGQVTLRPVVDDNMGVRAAGFYLDGTLLGTDFAPPFELALDTRAHPNGPHALRVVAHDLAGRTGQDETEVIFANRIPDLLPPQVWITSPEDGHTVSRGIVEVIAHAHDEDPNVTGSGPVARVEFYVDGMHKATVTEPDPPFTYTYSWNTFVAADGERHVRAVAYDDAGNDAEHTIIARVPELTAAPIPPVIEVSRLPLENHGTWYRTGLRVENTGFKRVTMLALVDRLVGFQARTSGDAPLSAAYTWHQRACDVSLGGHISLDPGEAEEITYRFVPILYESDVTYQVGESTTVTYLGPDGSEYSKVWSIPETADLAVADAVESAHYLVVTSPRRLFDFYATDDVNDLLNSMAKLAAERRGVLGYLYQDSHVTMKNLVRADGKWGSQLFEGWGSDGYLLLVGETEIIPSVTIWDEELDAVLSEAGYNIYPLALSDNNYADTEGSDLRPELHVGRIVGNDATNLRTPIETSLQAGFDCGSALAISGVGGHVENFVEDIGLIGDALEGTFGSVTVMHGENYADYADRVDAIRAYAPGIDFIVYDGHGGDEHWSNTFYDSDFPLDTGGTNPLVLGLACYTGTYEGAYSIAEVFLDNGAGVYIGASDLSSIAANGYAGEKFASIWAGSGVGASSGSALKITKRQLIAEEADDYDEPRRRLWVMQYNLYGDPKYAACSAAAASPTAARMMAVEPPPELALTMPDYVVTSADGVDHVRIPGGALRRTPGTPVIPYFVEELAVAPGYRVQDVTLIERSGLVADTGLVLPTAVDGIAAGVGMAAVGPAAPGTAQAWDPAVDFEWETFEEPGGGTTLAIRVFPFRYNALTTDVEFYRHYRFSIRSTESGAAITSLATDKAAYGPGAVVMIDLVVHVDAAPQDVVVSAQVRSHGSGDSVAGLLLDMLEGIQGRATYALRWNPAGVPHGNYIIETLLLNGEGDVLDRAMAEFSLGIVSAGITGLTATPALVRPGEPTALSLSLRNTGTVPITGTAEIRVRSDDGPMAAIFAQPFSDLAPGVTTDFDASWDTSGLPSGIYRATGTARFAGQTAAPAHAEIELLLPSRHRYMPWVRK